MRLADQPAIIADIHGNVAALEAVLANIEARKVSGIVNLGDCMSGPPVQLAEDVLIINSGSVPRRCDAADACVQARRPHAR